jgi:N-methylhydantoinase B
MQEIPPGERLLIMTPGGGGNGSPGERDSRRLESDLKNEFVSAQDARHVYGAVPPALPKAKAAASAA